MAIQTVNLTVPGGDTPRSANTKINANFTNTTHAASRIIGTGNGQVPEYISTDGVSGLGYGGYKSRLVDPSNGNKIGDGTLATGYYIFNANYYDAFPDTLPYRDNGAISIINTAPNAQTQIVWRRSDSGKVCIRTVIVSDNTSTPWREFYHTGNTTKESETGYLVASSPVLKVQHDSFEKVHEAEQLDIDVQRVATGVYEISGTTGLRDNDGWYLKPPKDINGNVLCICEATQDGDIITLKTYKKKFDFETVSIVADYEQPTDIPEGAEVMLRFNDLPAESMPQGV